MQASGTTSRSEPLGALIGELCGPVPSRAASVRPLPERRKVAATTAQTATTSARAPAAAQTRLLRPAGRGARRRPLIGSLPLDPSVLIRQEGEIYPRRVLQDRRYVCSLME